MTDYNDLITRLRSMDGKTPMAAADAIAELVARVSMLESARIAYASEFSPDGEGLPDAGSIHQNIRALKTRVAELHSSLSEVVGDLEMRSHLKRGEDYGLVDVSNGVYMRAKHALGQLEGEEND